jgi:DNA-3-methyladenine glycosylase II
MIPNYWHQASAELAANDPLMAELVERYAGFSLASRGDPFATLARSIVG